MKIGLVSIDSKYIHTNLAIRYLKANLSYPSTLVEFTIKDSIESMMNQLTIEAYDVIGFSVYLWNVTIVKELTRRLKAERPVIIVYGGPEVSYDAPYYLTNTLVDYIICGEGELAFNQLIQSIQNKSPLCDVVNLAYRDNGIRQNPIIPIEPLSQLKSPYDWMTPEAIQSKIQYVELSRGCPFHCAYCLASLENSVRFFDLDTVKSTLISLMNQGANVFKFLDRTFNYNMKIALDLFDFLIENHPENTVFQFEITGDLLPETIIDHLNRHAPKGLFRFEIGIQSTHERTNQLVDRHQNNEKLFHNIKKIIEGNVIDLHLDLIAGLPDEDLNRFKLTFDTVYSLYAKELQLGFLKMLRGTKLRRNAHLYDYRYDENPPYEMIQNNVLSSSDVNEIHITESILELFWNKGFMNTSFQWLTQQVESPFDFMNTFGHELLEKGFDFHRYQLVDCFTRIDAYVKTTLPHHYVIYHDLLVMDYLRYAHIKPQVWWKPVLSKANKNEVLRRYHAIHKNERIDDLYKYGIVIERTNDYLIGLFYPDQRIIDTLKKETV